MTRKLSKVLPPKTAQNTCALTGERLRDDLPRVRVRDDDLIVYPRNPRPGEFHGQRLGIPLRLHRHTPDGNGAPQHTPAMKKRFDELDRVQEAIDRQWWNDAYVLGRCLAHASAPAATFTQDELTTALASLRGQVITGHTPYWIDRAAARVRRWVRRTLRPADAWAA